MTVMYTYYLLIVVSLTLRWFVILRKKGVGIKRLFTELFMVFMGIILQIATAMLILTIIHPCYMMLPIGFE